MTISILGAGWLGMPFGKKLSHLGYTVKGSTTRKEKLAAIREAGLQAYILKVEKEIVGIEIDDFFHCDLLLLNIPPGRKNPTAKDDYPRQVATLLRKAQENGTQKCILISSTSVYGNENRTMTEEDALKPDRKSGYALIEAEKIVQETFGASATILRMAGLSGPGRQMGRFLAGRKGLKNGKAPVNLVHLDDCLAIMLEIIEQDQFGKIYNVCADKHPIRQDIYPVQARKLGLDPPTFSEGADDLSYKVISNEKLKKELGYSFSHPDPMKF